MTQKTSTSSTGFWASLRSAIAASHAVEGGRQPAARDLRTLGIDPEQFPNMRR